MKTVKQWFEEQEPEIAALLLKRMRNPTRKTESLWVAIDLGFNWEGTPEGHNYWSMVKNAQILPFSDIDKTIKEYNFSEKESKEAGNKSLSFKLSNGYKIEITFSISPFGNCQNFAISNFENLLQGSDKDIYFFLLKTVFLSGKRLLIIDIKYNRLERIKNLFNDCIIFEQPYESTNGSKMIILMIKLTTIQSKIKQLLN